MNLFYNENLADTLIGLGLTWPHPGVVLCKANGRMYQWDSSATSDGTDNRVASSLGATGAWVCSNTLGDGLHTGPVENNTIGVNGVYLIKQGVPADNLVTINIGADVTTFLAVPEDATPGPDDISTLAFPALGEEPGFTATLKTRAPVVFARLNENEGQWSWKKLSTREWRLFAGGSIVGEVPVTSVYETYYSLESSAISNIVKSIGELTLVFRRYGLNRIAVEIGYTSNDVIFVGRTKHMVNGNMYTRAFGKGEDVTAVNNTNFLFTERAFNDNDMFHSEIYRYRTGNNKATLTSKYLVSGTVYYSGSQPRIRFHIQQVPHVEQL